MKVLILSNYNAFALSLISRLSKEGKQVFVITGSERETQSKPKDVFQEYNFSFDNRNMSYIIKNIDPQIIIIGAGLDNLYELENTSNEVQIYLSGITNIISRLNAPNLKSLIYASSLLVFSGNTGLVHEDTIPKPLKESEKAVLMGEEICRSYNKDRNYAVTILRFGEIYGNYNNHYIENNICTEMCEKVINNKAIEIQQNKKHLLIHLEDAVYGLYKVVGLSEKEDEIYHIGPNEDQLYLEEDLVFLIDKTIETVKYKNEEENKEFNVEKLEKLNFNLKYKAEDKIKELYKAVKKSEEAKEYIENKKLSLLGRIFKISGLVKNKILPYAENLVFFLLLNIFIYFTKSIGFHEIIDVYLLYVVVIAVVYGYQQTVFSVILSVISRIYFTFVIKAEILSLTDYPLYMWILQLFAIGVLVGYIKDHYEHKRLNMKDENSYLEAQLEDIKIINSNNQTIKDLYEHRLLNYKDSFGRIYKIVSELDLIEPEGIIFKAVKVVASVMNTEDVSIYISAGKSGFFRLAASTSEKSKSLKNSLYMSDHPLIFKKLEKREIYVNTSLDPRYPMMAEGVYNKEGLESVIMVWTLPFGSNNLYQMNVFGVLCKLIEGSLNRALEYMSNIKKSHNLKYENVLGKESFEQVLKVYEYGASEGIAEYSIIPVKKAEDEKEESFIEILRRNIRDTDYIGVDDNGHMRILLTNTNKEGSEYVKNRLTQSKVNIQIPKVEGDK